MSRAIFRLSGGQTKPIEVVFDQLLFDPNSLSAYDLGPFGITGADAGWDGVVMVYTFNGAGADAPDTVTIAGVAATRLESFTSAAAVDSHVSYWRAPLPLIGGNPNWSDVLLQIQDNEDGDESAFSRVLAYNGPNSEHAGGVYDAGYAGVSADCISVPNDAAFGYAGDFTIEMFGCIADRLVGQQGLYAFGGSSPQWSNYITFAAASTTVTLSTNGTSIGGGTGLQFSTPGQTITVDVPFDWALTRKDDTYRYFEDGVMLAKGVLAGALFNGGTGQFVTGALSAAGQNSGFIKYTALRDTDGIALYDTDASYIVPSLPLVVGQSDVSIVATYSGSQASCGMAFYKLKHADDPIFDSDSVEGNLLPVVSLNTKRRGATLMADMARSSSNVATGVDVGFTLDATQAIDGAFGGAACASRVDDLNAVAETVSFTAPSDFRMTTGITFEPK